jgi:hypothetical protein
MPDETPEPSEDELPAHRRHPGTDPDGAPDRDPNDGSDGETTDPASIPEDDAIGRDDTLPREVVDEAERLTRLARETVVDAEAEAYLGDRADLLAEHDYTARIRKDDTGDVLVLHPDSWVEDSTIRTDRIEDVDRGIEVALSGPGVGDDWEEIDSYNRAIVESVREVHGDTHAANVAALADFAGNHYAKPLTELTAEELAEFVDDYFRRNAWPTDEQRAVVEKSVELAFDAGGERCPSWRRR